MSQIVGVRRARVWVAAAVGAVVIAGAVTAVATGGPDPVEQVPKAQAIEMTDACIQAAQAKLQPRITYASGEATFERKDGSDWLVRTAVNHKTKWSDNWFDVTCVVGWTSPDVTVRSVDTAAR